jgi:hypothetical protein
MKVVQRGLIGITVAILVVGFSPLTVLAGPQYQDPVSGYEFYATSTEGQFAGSASGDLPGSWSADVLHTPLSGSPQTAAIDGGTFDLYTRLHNQSTLISGTFTGGSVTQTGGFADCSNETYSVNGLLGGVGIAGKSDHGSGTFSAVLTHYRFSLFGDCVTYAASISGSVLLNL